MFPAGHLITHQNDLLIAINEVIIDSISDPASVPEHACAWNWKQDSGIFLSLRERHSVTILILASAMTLAAVNGF